MRCFEPSGAGFTGEKRVLIASGELSPLVQDLGVCIVASAVFGVVFERLRIPTIAALLGAGVLVGPIGFALVARARRHRDDREPRADAAAVRDRARGQPASLLASGRTLVLTGSLQVPLTHRVAALGVLRPASSRAGRSLDGSYTALYLGVACAFSSTLLVVKLPAGAPASSTACRAGSASAC